MKISGLALPWLMLALAAAPFASVPPSRKGECRWVHGRFAVYSGSSVQRIWIAGGNRIVAIRDDDPDIPKEIAAYEKAGPFTEVGDALYADFHICALEDLRPGRMQHVRVDEVRNSIFRGKPFAGETPPTRAQPQ